ncbi:Cys/Met metabolism PLP-dependent enzyme-domain-containing protein [Pisolithus sp. B1]|nr:Cys/Met metabolism PLP-dependent enzyme-domain-containing protein [Pisolithus sp. B1]
MTDLNRQLQFETLQLHAGQSPDPTTRARAVPIYASTSFVFGNSTVTSSRRVEICRGGRDLYPSLSMARGANPLLGGLATSTPVSATPHRQRWKEGWRQSRLLLGNPPNSWPFPQLQAPGITSSPLTFKKYGIGVKFVLGDDPEAFEAAIDEKTKAIYVESIGNSKYNIAAIPDLAKVAHKHGIPLIVDNTFGMGGYLIRPISLGADIVVHSATKWIGGHGTTIAGVVIDSGKFDWTRSGKFSSFTEPSKGYHSLVFSETFGPSAFAVKLRMELLRDLGPALNPFGAFLLIQGLETPSLRAQRHSDNALALATCVAPAKSSQSLTTYISTNSWLSNHPKVSWVSYLGLPNHGYHERAKELLRPDAFGGVLSFGVKGDITVVSQAVDNLRLASHLANVGDAKTLVIHPATTTHQQLTADEQLATGVTPDLIRVCG